LYSVDLITGGVLFIVGIGVVLGVISGSFMLAVIFVIRHRYSTLIAIFSLLFHGQVAIIFVVSVCLFVCAEFFSAVFDPISIKLGHMLYVWV